jgi:5-methylcytosine-specific restriction protein A
MSRERGTMSTWIFQCNPERFDLLADWATNAEASWSANQHRDEMQPNDVVYFRISGPQAGLYGVGTILSECYESPNEFGDWKVDIRYDRLIEPPLLRRETDEVPLLKEYAPLTGRQATNFPLPDEVAIELEVLLQSPIRQPNSPRVSRLNQLTSREAVIAAIHEYDQLGKDAFLERYGFGEARSYFLVHDEKEYDSKAIAGVAYKNQFGTLLGAADFSGGHATVQKKMKSLGFLVRGTRKPTWVRDELILALDLYRRLGALDDSHPDVIELSNLLNGLPIHTDWRYNVDFRNANGVSMKLGNFQALDPSYSGVGLKRGSREGEQIWDEFHDQPELLRKLAEAIRLGSVSDEAETFEDGEDEAQEGRILTRIHRSRERNQNLVAKRKAQRRTECNGSLTCEACGFDFVVKYGDRGDGFAECHHKIPLAESGSTKTRLDDLAILCANCHRMIHVRKPMLSVAELRSLIINS